MLSMPKAGLWLLVSSLLLPVIPTLPVIMASAKEIPRMKAIPYKNGGGLLSPTFGQSILPPADVVLSSDAKNAECEDPVYDPCAKYPYCCLPGDACCGNYSCCPRGYFCFGYSWCCKNGSQTCGGKYCCTGGSMCCKGGCCDPGHGCCGANHCHPPNTHCCGDNTYCPNGYACASGDRCISEETTETTTPTTFLETTTSTSDFFSFSLSSSTSLSIPTPKGTSTTSTSVLTPSRTTSRVVPSSTTSAVMPTITFFYVDGLTDYLVSNICLGMRKRGKTQNDTLAYDPTNKNQKRAAAGCVTGKCNYPTTGMSCDEYPFASTAEGGAGAQVGCVPAYQNTDQGGYLSSFIAIEGITPGKTFGVEVSGVDCSLFFAVGPLRRAGKRASDGGRDVSGSGHNSTVLKPYSIGSQDQGRVLLPLGDLDNGSYTVNANTGGQFSSVMLVDSDGGQYANQSGASSSKSIQINFQGPAVGLGIIIFTTSSMLNATYTFNGTVMTGAAVLRVSVVWSFSIAIIGVVAWAAASFGAGILLIF